LAQTWLSSSAAETKFPDLRRVFFAGEPLKDSLIHAWREHFPNCQIINLYGPTETTLAKCFYEVPEQALPGIQPVGSPLPRTQALVRTRATVVDWRTSEIVIRTPFRTFGYINAPEEQARSLCPTRSQDPK
jgi:acyl-coenzyme A synthetase/AMP-(fatty) acid ligase